MSPARKSSLSNQNRSRSASIVVPMVVAPPNNGPITVDPSTKRNHSHSVSSVSLVDSDEGFSNIDLEKQIILTAGGKRENVFGFLAKLLLLTAVVLGCSVLIFYAL